MFPKNPLKAPLTSGESIHVIVPSVGVIYCGWSVGVVRVTLSLMCGSGEGYIVLDVWEW